MGEDNDKDSKTEEPTGKKLSEAHKEGNFAQSPEVPMLFGLASVLAAFIYYGERMVKRVFEITTAIFENLSLFELTQDNITFLSYQSVVEVSKIMVPILGAAMIAGITAGGLQSGFRLTPKVLGLKFAKLNPITGAKRLVSKDVFTRFGIDLLKLIAMIAILSGAVRKIIQDPIFSSRVNIEHIGIFMIDSMIYVLIRLVFAMALIALISFLYQKKKTHNDLKMTKEEVKQERKGQDMSPEIKSARMKLAMKLLQGEMLDDVATADVVVTNPTHFAVALKYERGVDNSPIVVAKGENAFAMRIKEMAKENGVPIVENKVVARMLYKFGQVGKSIPMEMYQSVAEILAFVYKTHKYYYHKLKQRRAMKK